MTRPNLAAAVALALTALAACSDDPAQPASAFATPIDFSWACEGDGQTVPPELDERPSAFNSVRACPDVTQAPLGQIPVTVQGDLFGVVLNRQPAGLIVLQMNPASGTRRFVDADRFLPGITGVPVGEDPIRVLRADDFSAFYVLSAGDQQVTRVVLEGLTDELEWSTTAFALPGTPANGATLPDTLVVASADAPELWVYDLGADPAAPPLAVVPTPDIARELVAHDGRLYVAWARRPVISRVAPDGTIEAEIGVVAACRDTLDNDGDGLADRDDPDCTGSEDDDEGPFGGGQDAFPVEPPTFFTGGAGACGDLVDNDGDGFTDFPDDPSCEGADDDGEWRPGCSDGVDNDGDGLVDFPEDPSCYGPAQLVERPLPVDGPFHLTVIDGGDAGTFLYVLDASAGEIAVAEVGADGALTRVDVNAEDAAPPALTSVPYSAPSSEPTVHDALPAVRFPAYRRQGQKNIVLGAVGSTSLSSSRLRGELWDRIIDGGVPFGTTGWTPPVCAPESSTECLQPALDDATWYAFGARLDGRIQLIEAIRRGTPVHRLAQQEPDVDERGMDVSSAPRLTVRGELIIAGGNPQEGYPLIGAALEELLSDVVPGEAPPRLRRFGVWPPTDLEEIPTETWSVTYEGAIPGTEARLGRMLSDTDLYDPNAAFCEDGVAPGDWLQIEAPTEALPGGLRHQAQVVTDDGEVCAVRPTRTQLIEVRVATVGMSHLEVDPTSARLRPHEPTLDEDAIDAAGVSQRACQQALDRLDETLGFPENLVTPTAGVFAAANLPGRFRYRVRTSDWALVGTVSGFLHRQVWDRDAGACVIDETLDPRLTGRHVQAAIPDGAYLACPPPIDQLRYDTIDALIPGAPEHENPSFALDVLPGCRLEADRSVSLVPSQQDTAWSFTVTGAHLGATLGVRDSRLGVRVPVIDHRRHQVQLDTAGNRATLLQVRPDDPDIIVIFE